MGLLRYGVRRILQAVMTLLAVMVFTFFLGHLTGSPAALMLPATATPSQIQHFQANLGLDRPLPVQLWRYLVNAVHLNFGNSTANGLPAMDVALQRLPATLELAGVAFAISVVTAVSLALVIEITRFSWLRSMILVGALVREGIALFVVGLLSILVFGVELRWFPVVGENGWKSFVLPSFTLASASLAFYLRLFRSSFADERRQGYARTAAAKGESERRIVIREMLPNVLLPVVTMMAINFGYMLVGSVVVETVFSWPGVAGLVVSSVEQRDFPVTQAIVVILAAIFIAVNAAADILYVKLDPRIRIEVA